MKVLIGLTAAVALVVASPSFAQGVTAGVKIGVTVASLPALADSFDDVFGDAPVEGGVGSRTGLIAGGFVRVPVTDMFAIQPELLYAQKGATLNLSAEGETATGSFEINYVEIPVLAALTFAPRGNVRPFVFGGPAFGIKVGARAEVVDEELEGFDESLKDIDVGVVVGAGAELSRFILEARYNFGLSELNDDPEPGEPVIKNRAFSVLVGVRFP